jgi:phosphopantothenoylcysteine decarboxylase/phosphopantothenate--cysteine ligase
MLLKIALSGAFMNILHHKKIILGITGSIAAYKTPELVRELKRQGAEVKVIMTKSAESFVTTTTLHALSTNPVYTDEWLDSPDAAMDHISLARWADLIFIAPASADILARLAQGHANDLLTTTCLAAHSPIVLAPAMNQHMWQNAFVQANVTRLQQHGIDIIHPDEGEQACGDFGWGRLPELAHLISSISGRFSKKLLKNSKILITAGPTFEAIDPVRYLGNRSSGKMGYALAEAASLAGAEVTLISGPTALTPPCHVNVISVISAAEMYQAVMNHHAYDIFIGAAAVSDFTPEKKASHKIKKSMHSQHETNHWSLNLIPNRDILKAVASLQPRPFVVGFAAETENLIENAQQKLISKQIDLIIANSVDDNRGFESDYNNVITIDKMGRMTAFDDMSKKDLAKDLIVLIHNLYRVCQDTVC